MFVSRALKGSPLSVVNKEIIQEQVRNASSKQIKTRLVTVTNIRKITSSMKMVAAAKMKKCEDQLQAARAFAEPMVSLIPAPKMEASNSTKYMYVPMTSDRGLCGSVNTAIVRSVRNTLNARVSEGRTNFSLFLFGDKARAGLERVFGRFMSTSITEVQKVRKMNFRQASELANLVSKEEFDFGELIYNKYKNAVSFETMRIPIQSFAQQSADADYLSQYTEIEGSNDVFQNLYEYQLAVRMYHYFCELDTSELSARMTAMGNSSKSAGEMIDTLRLLYNRRRQAKITTELIEIISGATALDDSA